MSDADFSVWSKRAQAQTELILTRFLPQEDQILQEAMRYSSLGGGKRIRAMLAFAASEISSADEKATEQAVAALEFLHAYSLVHDDLPCMDNDALRRGKPTCHVAFGETQAVLAGDALQTLAFEVLSQGNLLPATQQLRSIHILARASGAQGMILGESIDVSVVGQNLSQKDLEIMHSYKTGALIEAAVVLGYLCCYDPKEEVIQILQNYARHLGLAFQVMDDVLDVQSDTATLGKTAQKDEKNQKPTFVSLLGLQEASQYAQHLHQQAVAALKVLDYPPQHLFDLADFIVHRNY